MNNDPNTRNSPDTQSRESSPGIGPTYPAPAGVIRRLAGPARMLAATIRRRRQAASAGSARRRFDYWIRAFTVTPYRAR
jgi:hypothetical protein